MRNFHTLALLILAAVCFTLGGVCTKNSAGLTRMYPSILMSLLFLTGAAAQALGMRQQDMSDVYISVLGLESVLAFVLGAFVLGESISATRLCALALITTGVILLHR